MTRIWIWLPVMAAFVTTTTLSLHSVQAGQYEHSNAPSDEGSLVPSLQTIFVEEGTDEEEEDVLLHQIEDSYAWRKRASIEPRMKKAQEHVNTWTKSEAWYDDAIKDAEKELSNKQLLQAMITSLETSIDKANEGKEKGLSVAKLQEVITSAIEAGIEKGADEETITFLNEARDGLIQKLSLPGMPDVLNAEMLAEHVLSPLAQKKRYTQSQIDALEEEIVKQSEHHESIQSALPPERETLASLQEEFVTLNEQVQKIEGMLKAYEQGKSPLPDASFFVN